jgi:hypothetical protein
MAPRMVRLNRIEGGRGRGRVDVAPTDCFFVGAEVVARRGEERDDRKVRGMREL